MLKPAPCEYMSRALGLAHPIHGLLCLVSVSAAPQVLFSPSESSAPDVHP